METLIVIADIVMRREAHVSLDDAYRLTHAPEDAVAVAAELTPPTLTPLLFFHHDLIISGTRRDYTS
jgi:hypothetical protein